MGGIVMNASARRLLVALSLTSAVAVVTHAAHAVSPTPLPLAAVPMTIGAWHGSDAEPFDAETMRILAADTTINRTYASASHTPVGFYAAYYAQQRPGVSIHSPLHCLPGTGWEPLDVSSRTMDSEDGLQVPVRRMLVRKEHEQALVLYWYSIHGRIVANELHSKFWLLHDSLRYGRSDAALIRLSVPVSGSVESAERDALAFGRALLPTLSHLWS
jgi:EpsI family protein